MSEKIDFFAVSLSEKKSNVQINFALRFADFTTIPKTCPTDAPKAGEDVIAVFLSFIFAFTDN